MSSLDKEGLKYFEDISKSKRAFRKDVIGFHEYASHVGNSK